MPEEDFPEILNQPMLAGTMLVGRSGVAATATSTPRHTIPLAVAYVPKGFLLRRIAFVIDTGMRTPRTHGLFESGE